MTRQSVSKGSAPSSAYTIINAVIWLVYVALVLLVVQVLAFADPLAVMASVLVTAVVLLPLRRGAARAAQRVFNRR